MVAVVRCRAGDKLRREGNLARGAGGALGVFFPIFRVSLHGERDNLLISVDKKKHDKNAGRSIAFSDSLFKIFLFSFCNFLYTTS